MTITTQSTLTTATTTGRGAIRPLSARDWRLFIALAKPVLFIVFTVFFTVFSDN